MAKAEKPKFEMKVVKVLKSTPVDHKNRIDMMIARWKLGSQAVLENRRVFVLPDRTTERFLKAAGFTIDDVRFIRDNADEICRLMEAENECKE